MEKKIYIAPVLSVHGSVEQVTQNVLKVGTTDAFQAESHILINLGSKP